MGKISIDFNQAELSKLRKNVREVPREVDRRITPVVDYDAAYGQGYMRANAPWTDRTGAARNGLFAIPGHYGKIHEIFLTYSVYYGIWLEVANSGRYQILQPVLLLLGRKLMRDLEGILNE